MPKAQPLELSRLVQLDDDKDGNPRFEYKGYNITLAPDQDPTDPREWDNVGKMVCWHSRYNLGDKHDFADPDEFEKQIKGNKYVILPLYLFDHSGITMKTSPFSCPWDSGQVGWIYCSLQDAFKHHTIKGENKKLKWDAPTCDGVKLKDRIIGNMTAEVKDYANYLEGNVVGYIVSKDGENYDSCWGYFQEKWDSTFRGYETPVMEAMHTIDHLVQKDEKEANEKAYWQDREVLTA